MRACCSPALHHPACWARRHIDFRQPQLELPLLQCTPALARAPRPLPSLHLSLPAPSHRPSHTTAPPPFAHRSSQFVLPVFKGPNAFENFFVQCQLPIVLFTTLEEYKR